jgi:hypothetical protein
MSKDKELQFLRSVREIFDSVFNEYGFEFQNESIWKSRGRYYAARALKGDIELIFYLAVLPEFCNFSLEISVSGKSAEKAISTTFRSMNIGAIASRIDPNYRQPHIEIRTKQDLKEGLEIEKECLLRYCKGILSGDASTWLNVVSAYVEEFRRSGLRVD